MEKINKIIPKTKTGKALKKEMGAAFVCTIAGRVLAEEKVSCRVVCYKNKKLILLVKNSVVAHGIQLRREELVKKINQKTGQETVAGILFRVA